MPVNSSTERVFTSGALPLCYGAMMCLAIAVTLPPVYLTTFGDSFGGDVGLNAEQLGRIPALVFASLVLGMLIGGPLADRWGGKLFAMLGLALTCAGLGLMAAAASYEMLLVSGCVMGFGSGMLDMVLSPVVCALRPDRRASAMNWLHSFYCAGAVCTVLIGSGALYLNISWRTVSVAMIAFPAGVFAGFLPVKVPPLVREDSQRQRISELLKEPYFMAALTAIALAGAAEQGMAQWLPAFAERARGCSKCAGGMVLAGFLVAMVLGRVLTAVIGRRIKPFRLMLICCGLSAFLIAVACFHPSSPVVICACIAVGLTVSCLWPTMLGVTGDRFPGGGASMFGLLAAFGATGCFVMPWIVGVIAERAGRIDWGLAAVALCPVAMAGVLLWMGTRRSRATSVPGSKRPASEQQRLP